MYFGYIDLKVCLRIIFNVFLISIIYLFIYFAGETDVKTVMNNNGFYKDTINGFEFYIKDISKVSNNIHELIYVELVPVLTSNVKFDGNLIYDIDYDTGVKIVCDNVTANKKGHYYLTESSLDNQNEHCIICNRYIGKKLIEVFNEKDGIILPTINTKYSSVHIYSTGLGMICLIYWIAYTLTLLFSFCYYIVKCKVLKYLKAWSTFNRTMTYLLLIAVFFSFIQLYILNLQ